MTANHSPTLPVQTIPVSVREQAAHWLVELQADDATPVTQHRWQQWREAHPDHELAWQHIERFTGKLHRLSSPLAHATLAPPDSPRRRQAIKALSVVLFGGSSAWLVHQQTPWRSWAADKHVAKGARETLTLDDGTLLVMNSNTAVNLYYSDTQRVIELVFGEILVTTGHDPYFPGSAYPLYVHTAQGTVRALGTRFTVRQDNGNTSHVAVFDGAVEIRPANNPTALRIVHSGWQSSFTDDAIAPLTQGKESATAWEQGMLVVEDMPLGEFIEELARYRPGKLFCDPAIAHLKVTGTYPLANTDHILDILSATHPVQLRTMTRFWVTVAPRT